MAREEAESTKGELLKMEGGEEEMWENKEQGVEAR